MPVPVSVPPFNATASLPNATPLTSKVPDAPTVVPAAAEPKPAAFVILTTPALIMVVPV